MDLGYGESQESVRGVENELVCSVSERGIVGGRTSSGRGYLKVKIGSKQSNSWFALQIS